MFYWNVQGERLYVNVETRNIVKTKKGGDPKSNYWFYQI